MINCNCFNDRDHSLLVFNKVFVLYFTLWMNYRFGIRSYMPICCCSKDIMMPSCLYFILWTPLSLNMWSWLLILAFASGQARSKIGELIRPFCITFLCWYLLHYGLLFHFMVKFLCLFSLILQDLHEEGECRQLEFWTGKEQTWETYSAQLQKS